MEERMSTRVRRPEGKEFPLAPEGLHSAVCADVWDVWTEPQKEEFGGGDVDKTRLIWQLDKMDSEGKPYEVAMMYTASLHEKAKLCQHLESWRGRAFTEEELNDFELENVIGVNCQLQIIHKISARGKKYGVVQTIVPARKDDVQLRVTEDFIRHKDRKKDDEKQPYEGDSNFQATDDDVPF